MIKEAINEYLSNLAEGLLSGAWKWLKVFLLEPSQITGNKYVDEIHTIALAVSIALTTLFFSYNVAKHQTQSIGGYTSRSVSEIFTKSFLSIIFAYLTPWIMFTVLLGISNAWSKMIFAKGVTLKSVQNAFSTDAIEASKGESATVIVLVILAVMIVVFAFQYLKREGELIIMYALAPFAASTMVNEEKNIFPAWFNEVCALVFMQPLQLTILYFIINTIGEAKDLADLYYAVGLMIVLIASPSWLRKILYSTGSGKNLINMAGGASKFAMYRLMLKR